MRAEPELQSKAGDKSLLMAILQNKVHKNMKVYLISLLRHDCKWQTLARDETFGCKLK